MPRQNRVTPFGEIIPTPARGMLMGNRGILHDESGSLTKKRWTHQAWVTCRLEFKGRTSPINAPHSYTQLFFVDEATALAAGHRPCAECRREDFQRFREAWLRGNPDAGLDPSSTIKSIDRVIHSQRVSRDLGKKTWKARLHQLPDGVFLVLAAQPETAYLKWKGSLYTWNPEGYGPPVPIPEDQEVTVLTPQSIAAAISAGFVPTVSL